MLDWPPRLPLPTVIVPHSVSAGPAWLATDRLHPAPSARELDWLNEQGSLTRRLTALGAGRFAVEPLCEGWQLLRDDECVALGAPSGSEGWAREVYLHGAGQPWVFARSVAARSALEEDGLDLESLGSRSLGELLFCDRGFTRQAIEVCRYPSAWLPPDAACDRLWARRSRFDRGALSVLVAETFLPALWHAANIRQEDC